ncbi:MAG: hypothetical protein ACOX1A_09335 [Saccharofermentanales bacterium]
MSRFAPFSDEALVDPCCGSGTIPIEAALLACRRAPGLNRSFAGEKWPLIGELPFRLAREEAMAAMDLKVPEQLFIFGSDLSDQSIKNCRNQCRTGRSRSFHRLENSGFKNVEQAKTKGLDRVFPPLGDR